MESDEPGTPGSNVASAGLAALTVSSALFIGATLILANAHADVEALLAASVGTTAVAALEFGAMTNLRGMRTFAAAFVVLLVGTWLVALGVGAFLFLVLKPSLFVF